MTLRQCIYEVLLTFDEVSVPRELADEIASAIEAGTAATVKQGAVHESAVAESETPKGYLP